jgi:hypothetical protein
MMAPLGIERVNWVQHQWGRGRRDKKKDRGEAAGVLLLVGSGSFEAFLYKDRFCKAGETMSMELDMYNLAEIKKWSKSRNWYGAFKGGPKTCKK